jgi:hypothetical protein
MLVVKSSLTPPTVTDGPPPCTWPASSVAYIRWEVGAKATGTRGNPGATLSQEVGAGAQVIRGTPEATLSREVRAGAMGTHGAPKVALR